MSHVCSWILFSEVTNILYHRNHQNPLHFMVAIPLLYIASVDKHTEFKKILICYTTATLKKSNKMQLYADIYLLLNYSTCFGRPSHPSSGVHKTVVAASGTDHTIWEGSFFKHDQLRTGLRQSIATIKWRGFWWLRWYKMFVTSIKRIQLHRCDMHWGYQSIWDPQRGFHY